MHMDMTISEPAAKSINKYGAMLLPCTHGNYKLQAMVITCLNLYCIARIFQWLKLLSICKFLFKIFI